MEVTPQIFDHIAKLAKLKYNDQEKETLRNEMQQMVTFVEKLNELDTTGVEPLTHISHVIQQPRQDTAINGATKQDALLNAPQTDGNYFIVPKVVENKNKA
jgi:aspartyl-tRNA(Asn)/glutamyl-tRNA(Gln) amidotransferase subunit C